MKNRVIYYPRIRTIVFYNEKGRIAGSMSGPIAKRKFWRLVKSGVFPIISLAKEKMVFC